MGPVFSVSILIFFKCLLQLCTVKENFRIISWTDSLSLSSTKFQITSSSISNESPERTCDNLIQPFFFSYTNIGMILNIASLILLEHSYLHPRLNQTIECHGAFDSFYSPRQYGRVYCVLSSIGGWKSAKLFNRFAFDRTRTRIDWTIDTIGSVH